MTTISSRIGTSRSNGVYSGGFNFFVKKTQINYLASAKTKTQDPGWRSLERPGGFSFNCPCPRAGVWGMEEMVELLSCHLDNPKLETFLCVGRQFITSALCMTPYITPCGRSLSQNKSSKIIRSCQNMHVQMRGKSDPSTSFSS